MTRTGFARRVLRALKPGDIVIVARQKFARREAAGGAESFEVRSFRYIDVDLSRLPRRKGKRRG